MNKLNSLATCCFAIVCCIPLLTAQSGIVEYNEFTPKGAFSGEKEVAVEKTMNWEEQLHVLMSAATVPDRNSQQKIRLSIEETFRLLEADNIRRKPVRKAIVQLEETLRLIYFKQYESNASFESLFKIGAYNNATASALYALFLGNFGLPYDILIEPRRIYPSVRDGAEQIALRTFDQSESGEKADERYMEEYLRFLVEMKLLDALELKAGSTKTLFYRYYLPQQERIRLLQLVGVLHYQQGLALYRRNNYQKALVELDEARRLYPAPRHDYARYACLYQLSAVASLDRMETLDPLFLLCRDYPTREVQQKILDYFSELATRAVAGPSAMETLTRYYDLFLQRLPAGKEPVRQIKKIYFLRKAQYHAKQGNQSERVAACMDTIFRLDPADTTAQRFFASAIQQVLTRERDPAKGLPLLQNYKQRYPFLQTYPYVRDMELCYRADHIRALFDVQNESEGLTALNEFERLLGHFGQTPRRDSWVTTAYQSAAYFYFRNQNYAAARNMFSRALNFAPNDAFLQHQQELMERY
ncbi:MAG: hypothetical protein HUU01_01650 [Saprospiraceae bacterium]|nr:hypothetical protein [Saprospiraceae bacterium]